jgi:hypothetical protein
MSRQRELSQWIDLVASRFGHVSRPQSEVLALWSFGIVLARTCGQTTVVLRLAALLGGSFAAWRQRLREWLREAEDKCGTKRRQVDVTACFLDLTRWVAHLWKGSYMLLAMDATTLGDRFTILAISVVYDGVAIPVAWAVLEGNTKRAWKPHWERLMDVVRQGLPRGVTVMVLADRGLSGAWLFREISRRRWHPLIRIKRTGCFRPKGRLWQPLPSFAPEPGTEWKGSGEAFKKKGSRIEATLLAYWKQGADEPWFLLTNLHPDSVDPRWYGYRAWIEQGFRLFKRAQWQAHRTRMVHPHRVERLWLPMALATLWSLSLSQTQTRTPQDHLLHPLTLDADAVRRLSRVEIGRVNLLVRLTRRLSLRPRPLYFHISDPQPAIGTTSQ